jgi:rSAM/selenodomain-associated transferase 1
MRRASAPTLIVFCREPLPGYAKKRLATRIGAKCAATLADAFIADALAKCRSISPGKLVIAASAPEGAERSAYFRRAARKFGAQLIDQGSGSLGARMARALERFCDTGAILLGTDTPSLPPKLLARSIALLEAAPVVLAPSLDGGYYLLAARGTLPDIFGGIAWGSAGVLRATIERLRRSATAYSLGPAWYDVDRWSDLLVLAAHLEGIQSHSRINRDSDTFLPQDCPCPRTLTALRRLGLIRQGR